MSTKIPKKIHYCWFGKGEKPALLERCIKSWKRYCPEYQVIEWNEENFDLSLCPLYVRQAYEEKKWAFVTDYVRLKVVYDEGGIYLDTDVELKKKLNKLLANQAFFAFEDGKYVSTGLGFGAVKKASILKEIMDDYKDISFILSDGSYDKETCPVRNTKIFLKHGLRQDDSMQILDDGTRILPSIYMCPIDYNTGKHRRSFRTVSIHWFSSTWMDENQKQEHEKRKKILRGYAMREFIVHMPNRVAMRILGKEKYNKLKTILRRRCE